MHMDEEKLFVNKPSPEGIKQEQHIDGSLPANNPGRPVVEKERLQVETVTAEDVKSLEASYELLKDRLDEVLDERPDLRGIYQASRIQHENAVQSGHSNNDSLVVTEIQSLSAVFAKNGAEGVRNYVKMSLEEMPHTDADLATHDFEDEPSGERDNPIRNLLAALHGLDSFIDICRRKVKEGEEAGN